MDTLVELNLEAIRWLQQSYPQLVDFFSAFTNAGTIQFYLAFLPLIYWCINKQVGLTAAYLASLSAVVNLTGKHWLRDWRPYWVDPSLAQGATEGSYGAPSNHVQTASVLYFFLASAVRRGYAWLIAIILVLLMALSRVYLGVHDVADVLAGFLISLLLLGGYWVWHRYLVHRYQNRILGQRLLLAIAFPLAIAAVYVVVLLILGPASETVSWASFVDKAETSTIEEFAQGLGVLLGLSIGAVMERSRVRFTVDGPLWQRALRYLVGLAGAMAIWLGLGTLFPDDPLWLAIPLRLLRYSLLGIWAAYYAPMLFVRLKLASAHPEPEVSVSINGGR